DAPAVLADALRAEPVADARRLHDRGVAPHVVHEVDEAVIEAGNLPPDPLLRLGSGEPPIRIVQFALLGHLRPPRGRPSPLYALGVPSTRTSSCRGSDLAIDGHLTPTAARRARRRAPSPASGRSRSTSPASPRRPGRPRAPAPCWAGSGGRRPRPARPRPRQWP